MKKQFCAALLLAAILLLFSGCGLWAMEARMSAPEARMETRTATGDAASAQEAPAASQPSQTRPPEPAAPVEMLTKEEAEAIALAHVGFARDQVSRLRTEYEIDDRIPQYDVQFHEGYWEYEFEIHAETGAILSFDKDD